MRRRVRILTFLVLALTAATVYFLQRIIQQHAEVTAQWTFSKDDIDKARKILDEGSTASAQPLKTLELNQKELNLLANYLLNRYVKSATQIGLHSDSLSLLITQNLPQTVFGRYLNIRLILTFNQANRHPVLSEFKIGKQHITPTLAGFLINAFIRHSELQRYYILASNQIKDIELHADKINIVYRFNADAYKEARQLLKLDTSHSAMQVYRKKLAEVIANHDRNWRLSLAELLQPLFALAAQRSTPDSAIGENKALIFTVAAYVNNQKIPVLLDTHAETAVQPQLPVYVYKRIDIAQHFMAAAAISAAGNSYFADGIGIEKELHDAKDGGSGFSFIDLAADRAGLQFGEIAVSTDENARKLQLAMAAIKDYGAFMPDVTDLPEHMSEEVFKSRFTSIDSEATQALIAEIDARINDCPIFAAFKE
ncbi:MAG: hypothetical protein ACU837_05530 [Gammaproteobacteria bacterium]